MHSKNFEKIKRYYHQGFWTYEMVLNATKNPASNPMITYEEFVEIVGENNLKDSEKEGN